jgi:glyoxylase-like metal-dependent hydrolase (beta-lactamase superfamily II)
VNAPAWKPRTVQAGEWKLTALSDGFMRLDGGSMWGVVPASMWRKLTPPAEDNTILIALRPFLAERGAYKVVIEPGLGDRWDPKWRAIYQIVRDETLAQSLQTLGLAPEAITHVVATHCHFDHIGAQVIEQGGALVPQFPRAEHWAPTTEIAIAKKPGHARAASYRAEDVEPIEARGLLHAYDGTREILPGLVAHVLGGHSDGVAVLTFNADGPGETAIFWSDVVPTTHHIQPPYIMAYDIDVVRSFEQRSAWLERAADGNWIGMFFHDVERPFARIARDGRRYALAGSPGT